LRVAVRNGRSIAYFFSARLRECVATTEEGLRLAQGDLDLGADRLGYSPSLGLSWLHGIALGLTGHLREGGAEIDRVIELARTSQQVTPLSVSHGYHVLRCEVTGEAAPALAHGRQAMDYAERTGSAGTRMFASLMLGVANVLNGAWHDALEVLETALMLGRERRLPIVEGRVLAAIAAAHLGLGDRERALAIAEESIAVSRRIGTQLWEFSAQLIRIRALRELYGIKATREIEATLAEAAAWLEMSGAKSYEPFLHVERAELARLIGDEAAREQELREAYRLFTEIGAPIRAAGGREGTRAVNCPPVVTRRARASASSVDPVSRCVAPSAARSCRPLRNSATRVASPAARPDPRSYTPKYLAEKILTSRSALEGARIRAESNS
jgi:hypothetical protein